MVSTYTKEVTEDTSEAGRYSMIFNPLDGDQKEHWKGLLKEIP